MESFGLYEDLSLFSGDLLVGMSPLADEFPSSEPDGGYKENTMFQQHVDLFTDEPVKPSVTDPEPAVDDWEDKKMDLINLLSHPNVQITIQDVPPISDVCHASPVEPVDANSLPMVSNAEYELLQPVKVDEVSTREALLSVADLLSSDLVDLGHHHSNASCGDDLSFSCLGDVNGDFSTDGLASLLTEEAMHGLAAPILSPVSPQDVEMILSSGPSSPDSLASVNDAVVPELSTIDDGSLACENLQGPTGTLVESSDLQESSAGPVRAVRASRLKKYQPYKDYDDDDDDYMPRAKSSSSLTSSSSRTSKASDRKERKKQQNKDAASRYRQKKKQELGSVFDECSELEKKNEDLKDKVDSMTREIQYLKELLLEVYKAKGIQPKGILAE